jgi:zinc protease
VAEVPTTGPGGALLQDPALVTGKLPNGLTYYVLHNAKPEKRAELWLAVNAGSVLEDDDQRGIAHFVEHMAFNGTKKYAKQQIVDWLENIGMKFGADVNARTGWDDTVYQIQVPTDDSAIVAHGLDVLHEWAHAVAFDPGEVDKERGVILEERRLGRGAQGRLLDKIIPAVLPDSKYGQRLPIGTEQIIKTATPDTLKRFYRDWYRPDLMAVIVVGDVDPKQLAKQIADVFGDLPAPDHGRPRTAVAVPAHAKPVVLALGDPELPITVVAVANKLPHVTVRDEQQARTVFANLLFGEIVNQRLKELAKLDGAPFIAAQIGYQPVLRPIDVWFEGGAVKGDHITETLELISTEITRVAKFGFVDTEIARAKKDVLEKLETRAREKDKTESSALVEDVVKTFLTGETYTSAEQTYTLGVHLLPAITAADLQSVASQLTNASDRVVLAAGNAKTKLPALDRLLAALTAGEAKATTAWVDDVASGPLVATPPKPGTIASEHKLDELGVTEWTLSNGIRVVLKPTDFQNDYVGISAFWLGGSSLASDPDYVAADSADDILKASGAGTQSATQLDKALAGTGAAVELGIGANEQVLVGSGQPAHLEQLMQLIYLRLGPPRRDPAAAAAWRDQQVKGREHQFDDPATAFTTKFRDTWTQHDARLRTLTSADFGKLDLEHAYSFYQDRVAHLGGLTFVVVGAFKIDELKPLILTYVGGLPAGPAEHWTSRDLHLVSGHAKFELKQGIEPKASVKLEYQVNAPWSREAEHDVKALASALSIRLREELREGMSGTYGVGVTGSFSREPTPKAFVEISFGCAPQNVDALAKAMHAIIAKFQADGPPQEVVDKIKETERRERETQLKTNGFWINQLFQSYRFGDDPRALLGDGKLTDQLTVARLRDAANRYLGNDSLEGVLRPAR